MDHCLRVLSELSVGAESHRSSFAEDIYLWPAHIAYLRPFPRGNIEPLLAIGLSTAETVIDVSTNVQAQRSMISNSRTTSSYSPFFGVWGTSLDSVTFQNFFYNEDSKLVTKRYGSSDLHRWSARIVVPNVEVLLDLPGIWMRHTSRSVVVGDISIEP